MFWFLVLLSSFLMTYVLCRLILSFFPKWGFLDKPEKDQFGKKRGPIPYPAGLAFVLTFILMTFIFVPYSIKYMSVMVGILIIVGMSFWDDRKGIKPIYRLLLQITAALVPILWGGILIDHFHNPLTGLDFGIMFGQFQLGGNVLAVLAIIITLIWIVGLINIFNWVDGLNGLPSGVGMIAAVAFLMLSLRNINASYQFDIAIMSIILVGALIAFFRFDFYPAKMLMGDTGSMFLGFIFAILAIYSGAKLGTAILVMGFPILDAIWVILRRIINKKSPLKGDLYHFHHRLLYFGLSIRQVLLLIYMVSLIFGLAAVFLTSVLKFWIFILMIVLMAMIGFWVTIHDQKVG